MSHQRPARAPTSTDFERPRPIYVVWEITLACNLKCRLCGSRAGAPRRDELTTAECLSLIDDLHRLGTREITLIGGEAYLRNDWLTLIDAISTRGILCGLQTGGRALTPAKIAAAAEAGLTSAGVSIDGLADVHDHLRGVPGSFGMALAALRACRAHKLSGSVNTQINTLNAGQLRELMDVILEAGATGWQVQLTVPMGRAADSEDLILQPYQLLELMPVLADLFVEGQRRGLRLLPGNNIGYFGPYETFWRSITGEVEYYAGCNAGRSGLGIEADGSIKGCPSLPSKDYVGGNVRETPLAELWHSNQTIGFTRDAAVNKSRLWGYCRTCYYADICQAGCTWTTHVLSGKPGNNPFCHHRALELSKLGLRERIVQRSAPAGAPFDYGLFDILVEDESGNQFPQTIFEERRFAAAADKRMKPASTAALIVCGNCEQLVFAESTACPHCDARPQGRSSTPDRDSVFQFGSAQIERMRAVSASVDQTLRALSADHARSHASASDNEPCSH